MAEIGPVPFHMQALLSCPINELAGRLKSLQVEIGELGSDYSSISVEISDAVDKLYAIHKRNENARKSAK
jgi:hypothetical protein